MAVISCGLASSVPKYVRPQGSVERPCASCGTKIVLTPSSEKARLAGARALCGPCVEEELGPGLRIEIRNLDEIREIIDRKERRN